MVRVTNYFETQVRKPEEISSQTSQRSSGASKSSQMLSHSQQQANGETQKMEMTNEQMMNWYAKVLDSVRLRHRKLSRFSKCVLIFFVSIGYVTQFDPQIDYTKVLQLGRV